MNKLPIHQVFGGKLRLRVSGILIENEKILLVKHQMSENSHLWSPPGGGLQFGESIKNCLKREFAEETGLSISVGNFLFINEFLEPPLHAIELFFEVKTENGKLEKGIDPEMNEETQIIKEVAFKTLAELQTEEPAFIHKCFRELKDWQDIFQKNTFYE
ncbi:MAG: NUDIX hydrolase [Thermonemataceae bacterium]|nr:NUDIX hydrolase [Thermonemataceae bacterium]